MKLLILKLIFLTSALNYLNAQKAEIVIAKSHDGKWAFFDSSNIQLSPFEFDSVYQANITKYSEIQHGKDLVWFHKGFAVVEKNNQFAIINVTMDYIVDWRKYQWISPISITGLFIVKNNNKYGLIDYKNNLIQTPIFDTISNLPKSYEFQNSPTFWAKQGNKYLIFDTLGNWKDSIYYDSIKVLQANYYLAFKDTMSLRLDRFGNKIIEDFRIIRDDNDLNGFLAMKNSKCGLVSRFGNIIVPFEYENIYSSHYCNYYIQKNGKWGLVNNSNNVLLPFVFDYITIAEDGSGCDNTNYIVVQKGKFGKYNSKGEEIFPCIYDGITTWVEYGPDGHFVRIGNKYGLIDYSGNIIIPLEYDKVGNVNKDGLSILYKNSKLGVFDTKGKNVILPILFDSIFISNYSYFSSNKEESKILAYSNGIGNLYNLSGDLLNSNISDIEVKKLKYLIKFYFDLCGEPLIEMIQNHTFHIPECLHLRIKEIGLRPDYFYYKMNYLD